VEHGAPPERPEPVVSSASVRIDWRGASSHTIVERVGELLGTFALQVPAEKRTQPFLVATCGVRREQASIELPAAIEVEAVPDPVRLESHVGTFALTTERHGHALVVTRELLLSESVVQAADYDETRKFFESIRRVEATPIILLRTSP